MREIKFRARNASLPRCWVYGYFVVEGGCNYIINDEGKFKVIAGTEGQFTGKICSGQKVYEGDIVMAHLKEWEQYDSDGEPIGPNFSEKDVIGEVRIRPTGGVGIIIRKVICEEEDIGPRHEMNNKFLKIREQDQIMGNKFENPELLEYPEEEKREDDNTA